MSIPVRNLPVVQNWDCQSCSDCCRIEAVITNEEKSRIEGLDLADDPEIGSKPWFKRASGGPNPWRLAHRTDGGCVFLTSQNRCRLQEKFGPEAKPFVCRLFPFVLIPAGNHWRVGLRFSCPAVASNAGRPVVEAEKELTQLSRMLEKHLGRSADSAPPPLLKPGTQLAWPDLIRVVQVLLDIVQDRRNRLERRLRICLAVGRICSTTTFDALHGHRLTEYLQAVRRAMDTEIPREPSDLPPPSGLVGRVPFGVLLAIHARRERVEQRARSLGRRLARVVAGWRFARGRGAVPRANEFIGETTFEAVENRGALPPEVDEILERYYVVKLNSLQFFGPPNFNLTLLEGLDSLALTLPMILWLARALPEMPPQQAVELALRLVDDHFGGDPMLGLPHIRLLQKTLAQRGEIDKLVAWYGR